MRLGEFMRSGGMIALAATLAAAALPASAKERGEGRLSRGGGDTATVTNNGGNSWGGSGAREGQGRRGDASGNANGASHAWRGKQPAPQAMVRPQPQAQPNVSRGNGNGGDRSGNWRGRTGSPPQVQAPSRPPVQVENRPERRNWSGDGQWQGQQQRPGRSPDAADPRRNDRGRDDAARGWRGNDVNRWNGNNNDDWSGGTNHAWRGNNYNSWRGDRRSYAGNWNRDWRRDNRYDWRGYRNANRNVYRQGAYYAPYRGYAYRRVATGFHLDAMFYGSRYVIANPWQYRLPPVYGPYSWVRYFDDALLVDIYSGEVVDVIYSFFW